MAMTTEKIREAFAACRSIVGTGWKATRRPEHTAPYLQAEWSEHLAFMCEEGATYAEGRREKAMRWLGFVQGALWAKGLATIDDLKSMNRPDEPPVSESNGTG
jgi:hypothetical protein